MPYWRIIITMTTKTQTNQEIFEATLTLRQEGKNGDVQAYLTFAPLLTEMGVDGQPEAYERMAFLMQTYLYMTGIVDEHGDLVDPSDIDKIDIDTVAYKTLN